MFYMGVICFQSYSKVFSEGVLLKMIIIVIYGVETSLNISNANYQNKFNVMIIKRQVIKRVTYNSYNN